MNTSYEYLVIGAGFAGICIGIKLKQAGYHNFLILERDADLGGTWLANHYPGAACDVQSHLYSYSFEPKADWSRMFGPQREIWEYMQHCAGKYGLTPHFKFNTTVTGADYDEAAGLWKVKTADTSFTAKVLISCTGGLSQPALPEIKGLDSFKGNMFHSARWNHTVSLEGKKVAVIGTGASAIQIVPAIAGQVKELLLFQRTPPWILPKPDRAMSAFEKKMFAALPFTRQLLRGFLYWRNELFAVGFVSKPGIMNVARKMALKHIDQTIADPVLRKKVTPTYTVGCKRVLLSNEYYQTLCRSNVDVITEGITEINASGLQTSDGKQHDVDAIVLATGFHAADGVVAIDLKGRNGLDINQAWKDGAEAYLGTTVSGFPNLFLIVGPNTGLGHSSMLLMIEAQVQYIMGAIAHLQRNKLKAINVKPEVQEAYNKDIQQQLSHTVWQTGGCHSWYQNKNGKNVTLWPGHTFTFMRRTKHFEADKYEQVA